MMGLNAFKRTVKKIQALKAFDNVTSTSLLQLIHKNPERRTRREIDLFLPTLIKQTDCLRNVERGLNYLFTYLLIYLIIYSFIYSFIYFNYQFTCTYITFIYLFLYLLIKYLFIYLYINV